MGLIADIVSGAISGGVISAIISPLATFWLNSKQGARQTSGRQLSDRLDKIETMIDAVAEAAVEYWAGASGPRALFLAAKIKAARTEVVGNINRIYLSHGKADKGWYAKLVNFFQAMTGDDFEVSNRLPDPDRQIVISRAKHELLSAIRDTFGRV